MAAILADVVVPPHSAAGIQQAVYVAMTSYGAREAAARGGHQRRAASPASRHQGYVRHQLTHEFIPMRALIAARGVATAQPVGASRLAPSITGRFFQVRIFAAPGNLATANRFAPVKLDALLDAFAT